MTSRIFVVVRGPALAGKTAVARALAQALAASGRRKVAVVSQDDLWERWIVGHDGDVGSEAALVYRLLKLLATGYLRDNYHIVVDASFAFARDGACATHESDLRELLSLVAMIPNVQPLLVSVTAPPETLVARAAESDRWDAPTVEAAHRAFEEHALPSPLVIDTNGLAPQDAAQRIIDHMGVRP